MRGLYNLQLVFYAWLGHFVKLLQVKLAQAVSPASPPFLTPEQSVFLPVARSAKWSSSKTLLDGPVMIPPETHSKIIHKRHLSQDTLHRCPWQDPLTQPDVVYARLLGQRSVVQLLSCPLMGAVPTDVPICALRCWRVKTKHPSQVFQVGSKEDKSTSGFGSVQVTDVSFKLAWFFCIPVFLCLIAQGERLPSMLYRQPLLNPES